MKDKVVTTDLAQFGWRELKMARELLAALFDQGVPGCLADGICVAFNCNSGYVFLTDEDYNVAMMNGDKLEEWFSCPNCGHEGFAEDMLHGEDDPDCAEYLVAIDVVSADSED